jgi:ATP-dependent RNA helicase RhlE
MRRSKEQSHMSSPTFAELGVSTAVADALEKRGIQTPFQIQGLVVPDVLAGHDVLAKSPTGSGKTLAFGVPICDRIEATDGRPAALILAPTRELASQIVEEIRGVAHARALSVAAVYGGAGIQSQAKAARKAHILVACPGRLEDLMARGAVRLDRVQVLVLDEADRMLDMGFRPAVDRIVSATPRDRQTLFFSATLDGAVGQIANEYTRNARRHEAAPRPERRADIEHRFLPVRHEAKLDALVEELRRDGRGLALVFVRTKRGADRLVKRLGSHNVAAVAMHGNKTQSQREKALSRFERGQVDTLVATDVAARGIDVEGVTHVIQFDAPEDRDAYVHRVGRTGRAGRTGIGITFVMGDQAKDMSRIAGDLKLHDEWSAAGLGGVNDHVGGGGGGPRRPQHARGKGRGPGGGGGQSRGRSSQGRSSKSGGRGRPQGGASTVASAGSPRGRRRPR